jgi:hypothetical protein
LSLHELAEAVDKATASDRLFFERHPDRDHRIRHAHTAKIKQARIAKGEALIPLPAGWAWFVVVRNMCRGARLRQFIQLHGDAETDLGEEICLDLFETAATPAMRKIESEMRRALCKEVQP